MLLMFYFSSKALQTQVLWLKRLYLFIPILLFSIIFGCRYGVGIDYYNYVKLYEEFNCGQFSEFSNIEIGFLFIMEIFHRFSMSVVSFFIFLAFIQIYLLSRSFEDEDNLFVLPYIYLSLIMTGIAMSGFMNGIRQVIAFCIFTFSLRYIVRKQILKYIICIIVAFLFHKSAVIVLPLFFIWLKRDYIFHTITIQLILLVCFFLFVFINPLQVLLEQLDDVIKLIGYENYIDSDFIYGKREIGLMGIINLLINGIIVLYSNKMKDYYNNRFFNIIYDLFFVGVCLAYLFIGSIAFGRIIMYFTYFQFIMYAYLFVYLNDVKLHSKENLFSFSVLSLFLVLSFIRVMIYSDQNTVQYVFFFQEHLFDIKDLQFETMMNNR